MEEKKYDFSAIESKWQKYWDEHQTFKAENGSTKPKFYALVEFPYPSGAGMHVGHIKAYSGLEVVSRKRRLQATTYCSRLALTLTVCPPRTPPSRPAFIPVRSPITT